MRGFVIVQWKFSFDAHVVLRTSLATMTHGETFMVMERMEALLEKFPVLVITSDGGGFQVALLPLEDWTKRWESCHL